MAKKRRQNKKTSNQTDSVETSNNDEFLTEVSETESMSSEENYDSPEPVLTQATPEPAAPSEIITETVEPVTESIDEDLKEPEQSFEQDEEISEPAEIYSSSTLIGDYLREKREAAGISLKNISQTTKISLTNLENLESNNLDALPNIAYVTGYVKSYNKALGLNEKEVLDILEKTYSVITPAKRLSIETLETTQNEENIEVDKIIRIAVVGIVVLAIIAGSIFLIRYLLSARKESNKEVTKTQKVIETQSLSSDTPLKTETESQNTEVVADTESKDDERAKALELELEQKKAEAERKKAELEQKKAEAERKKAELEQKKAEAERKKAELEAKKMAAEKKKDEIEKTDKPKRKFYKFNRSLYTLSELDQSKKDELIPQNFQRSVISGKQNVYIQATRSSSWITYKSDGDAVKKFVLQKGRSVLVRGNLVRVFLGNLAGVDVFLNNQKVNTSSSSGVKSLVFPQDRREEFVMPLFIYQQNGKAITSDEWMKENPDQVQR